MAFPNKSQSKTLSDMCSVLVVWNDLDRRVNFGIDLMQQSIAMSYTVHHSYWMSDRVLTSPTCIIVILNQELYRIYLPFSEINKPITLASIDGARRQIQARSPDWWSGGAELSWKLATLITFYVAKDSHEVFKKTDVLAMPLCRYELGREWNWLEHWFKQCCHIVRCLAELDNFFRVTNLSIWFDTDHKLE